MKVGVLVKCVNSYMQNATGLIVDRYLKKGSHREHTCKVLLDSGKIVSFSEYQLEYWR